jgi:hypothetical protein
MAAGFGFDDSKIEVPFLVESTIVFIFHIFRTGFGVHPTSYPMAIAEVSPCG